jgi:hypothetical protein
VALIPGSIARGASGPRRIARAPQPPVGLAGPNRNDNDYDNDYDYDYDYDYAYDYGYDYDYEECKCTCFVNCNITTDDKSVPSIPFTRL